MKVVVVGLGVQGNKRQKFAGNDCIAVVDPVKEKVDYKNVQDVPLDSYDAALLCIPDQVKYEIMDYLLENKKHLLVEKPLLFESNSKILDLIQKADRNQVSAYTAYNHRFEPHIMRMKEVIDNDELGQIYRVRLFYGNGTARDVRNSAWRDKGMGVLSDLGSHLLDIYNFVFEHTPNEFSATKATCFENQAYDHVVFESHDNIYATFEMTLLSWKNSFYFDVWGEKGSAHIDCLCKWGPSQFSLRKRKLPSGRPEEENEVLKCADPTWEKEYDYFKQISQEGRSNLQNDLWINSSLNNIFAQFNQG